MLDINHLPLENKNDLDAVFGRCELEGEGRADPAWEAANLVPLVPPYPMHFSWGPPVKSLRVHKLAHDRFYETLQGIKALLGNDVAKFRMDDTGGTQNFRMMRGSSNQLSVHSWGVAIDMDPLHNTFPHRWVPGFNMIRLDVVAIFEKNGFHWRGHDGDIDCMHFQLCRHRASY